VVAMTRLSRRARAWAILPPQSPKHGTTFAVAEKAQSVNNPIA
jgi:hypothetical protein